MGEDFKYSNKNVIVEEEVVDMGKFILCTGMPAKEPYYFSLTGTNVYSIEELGYYLYHNIYTIQMEDFSDKLFDWMQYDLNMEEFADKCRDIREKSDDIKDIVVSILCATDYFTKLELERLIKTIDKLNGLSQIERQKIKADNYLKYEDYENAIIEYEGIVAAKESSNFPAEAFGNILHNLAVAHIQVKAFERAKEELKRAYELNHNEETKKEFFFLLKLQKQEKEFLKEILNYNLSPEEVQEYLGELEGVMQEAEESSEYKKILNLPKLKEAGKVGEYYYAIDTMIFNWKQKYKNGME